jgi:hypothetical protein
MAGRSVQTAEVAGGLWALSIVVRYLVRIARRAIKASAKPA